MYKVWYAAHNVAGGGTRISGDALAHITSSDKGVLLCYQDKTELIKKAMCDKGVFRSGVIPGNPICPICEKAWKELPNSPWKKWTGNSAT